MNNINKLTITEEYLKRIEPYVILDYSLTDLLSYVKSTIEYLKDSDKEHYDLDEIIAYLETVPETIKEIRKIIIKMEEKINEYELQQIIE